MGEHIVKTEYSDEMERSYVDYAMSVIVSRAVPDIRDGLKPVQRRILYDMGNELGLKHDKPYRKSARIVGDTMGKFHPHGDSSIYEAMVVMSQDFKKEAPLIDGHGNFGSVEGDGAAASRYTEARLQKLAQDVFISDLDKDVVDFVKNYDETEKEPEVLPVRIPNFLINGSEGIAVGMTTSTPSHNLAEVIEAEKALIRKSDISLKELMEYIPGPDFPSGGIVANKGELFDIYKTGRGKVRIRGKIELEKDGSKQRLVVTEIPYTMIGAGIAKFMSDVAALVENREASEITDISNQSSKDGIRIVLDVKKDTDIERLKSVLYKKTKLEDTFGVNMLAIVKGRPEVLNLKSALENHVEFLFDVNTRKYTNLLKREQGRREIQEGLIKACDLIDLIIEIIRGSKNRDIAKRCMMTGSVNEVSFKSARSAKQASKLYFTENQANAILDMRLSRLIGLELEALRKEYQETLRNIESYTELLGNKNAMSRALVKELDTFKKEFASPRKTQILDLAEPEVTENVKSVPLVFLVDRFGYARTVDEQVYEKNRETADQENRFVVRCMSSDRILLFSDTGIMYQVDAGKVPYGKFRSKGIPLDNLCGLDSSREKIVASILSSVESAASLVFVTKSGYVKKVSLEEFNVRTRRSIGTKLEKDDVLVSVHPFVGKEQVVLVSSSGYFLRFSVDEIPEKKKNAVGVTGIKLDAGESLDVAFFSGWGENVLWNNNSVPFLSVKAGKRGGRGVRKRFS